MRIKDCKDQQVDFVPAVVRGDLAKIIADEVTRKSNDLELAVMREAMSERVRRGKRSVKGVKVLVD